MNTVIVYLLKILAIQGLFFLCYHVFLRKTGQHTFNRAYLLLTLILSFVIPFFEIPFAVKEASSQLVGQSFWPSGSDSPVTEYILIPIDSNLHVSNWSIVLTILGAVSIFLFLRSAFYLAVLKKLKNKSESINRGWFTLFKISQDRPFSFFKSVFIPQKMFGSNAFNQVLAHECVHVKQFHSVDRLFLDFIVSLFWFNPFIYLYRNALIEIHEYQADEGVLKKYDDPVAYQEIMFSQLQSNQYSGLVSHFNFQMIKNRIVMMNKKTKKTGWLYLLVAPVTLTMIFAFSNKKAMMPIEKFGNGIYSFVGPHSPAINSKQLSIPIIEQDQIPSIMPVKSQNLTRLTSDFGMRTHPISKKRQMHQGVDFACPVGTEIIATADGVISLVQRKAGEGYGNMIVVDHADGYQSRYAQLSEIKVKKGDMVVKGQLIALSGNSGASTAPHLHYEVMKDGKRLNPLDHITDYVVQTKLGKAVKVSDTFANEPKAVEKDSIERAEKLLQTQKELNETQSKLEKAEKELAIAQEQLVMQQSQAERQQLENKEIQRAAEASQKELEDLTTGKNIEYSQALFIVDGVPSEKGAPKDLKPSNINSVTVLKGKNARALYGTKGANGVIIIETKSGSKKIKNKSKRKARKE